MPSGHFIYMASPPPEDTTLVVEIRAGEVLEHGWSAPRRPWRVHFGQVRLVAAFGAGSGCQGGQRVAQDAGRHGAATRARSYAHSGSEDRGAEDSGNVIYFEHLQKH